jgi:YVTN family beta-propeller protein
MHTLFTKLSIAWMLTASIFQALGQTVKSQIDFPQKAAGIAVNYQTNRIYVVAPSFGGSRDTLTVIDGNDDKPVANISIPTGAYLPAVNVFTNRIYIGSCNAYRNPSPCFVTVLDGASNKVLSTIPITATPGNGIQGVAVDSTRDRIFVANASDRVIEVIDGRNNKVIDSIGVSSGSPLGIAINPFSGLLYVPLGKSQIDVIGTRPKKLIATTDTGKANTYSTVNWTTGQVFVLDIVHGTETNDDEAESDENEASFEITVLDERGTALAHMPLDDEPCNIDVDPVTNLIFVLSNASHTITVIDGVKRSVSKTMRGVHANFIATNMTTGKIYLAGESGVTVITEK